MPLTLIHAPQTPPLPSTTPSDARDYQGSAQVQTSIINTANGTGHALLGATTGDLLYAVSPTVIGGTQSLLAGAYPLLAPGGTAVAPSFAFSGNANTGIFSGGTNEIDFSAAGVQQMAVANNNVVINAPTFRPSSDNNTVCGATAQRWSNSNSYLYSSAASTVLTITGNAITPTNRIHHVGAGLIKNITVPASMGTTGDLLIVPDAAFTYDATGNIVVPAGGGTAVINRLMVFTWDGTKWTPSY